VGPGLDDGEVERVVVGAVHRHFAPHFSAASGAAHSQRLRISRRTFFRCTLRGAARLRARGVTPQRQRPLLRAVVAGSLAAMGQHLCDTREMQHTQRATAIALRMGNEVKRSSLNAKGTAPTCLLLFAPTTWRCSGPVRRWCLC
jgi:hypothetical protein